MSKLLFSLFAALALSVPTIALACPGHAGGEGAAACAGCEACKSGECPHAKAAKADGEAACPHHAMAGADAHHGKAGHHHDKAGAHHHGKDGDCACAHGQDAQASAGVKEISVDQVAALEKGKAVIFDVNNAGVRSKFGVIPGAVLLASSSQYDLSALPKDKATTLVFYCANTRCTAAPTAAKRAAEAGYTDVNVLHVGIAGWKDAGKKTDTPRS